MQSKSRVKSNRRSCGAREHAFRAYQDGGPARPASAPSSARPLARAEGPTRTFNRRRQARLRMASQPDFECNRDFATAITQRVTECGCSSWVFRLSICSCKPFHSRMVTPICGLLDSLSSWWSSRKVPEMGPAISTEGGDLLRQSDPMHQLLKAWVGADGIENRVHLEPGHTRVSFLHGFVQGRQGKVFLV